MLKGTRRKAFTMTDEQPKEPKPTDPIPPEDIKKILEAGKL
jgi:hypothetical protein